MTHYPIISLWALFNSRPPRHAHCVPYFDAFTSFHCRPCHLHSEFLGGQNTAFLILCRCHVVPLLPKAISHYNSTGHLELVSIQFSDLSKAELISPSPLIWTPPPYNKTHDTCLTPTLSLCSLFLIQSLRSKIASLLPSWVDKNLPNLDFGICIYF